MTAAVSSHSQATLPVVRSLLGKASREGKQKSGVLGIRARPTWSGPPEFAYADFKVRVVPCASALAVRDALRSRKDGTWLVVLTDRDESDLGVGITSHLYGGVLRNPDPWDAVRDQFGANRIDRRLVIDPRARDLAAGILAVRGDAPWPPARAGFLTLDHVCAVVANRHLGFSDLTENVSAEEVLAWAGDSGRAVLLNELRDLAGEPLAETVVSWLAARCGKAASLVEYLLNAGRVEDVIPLGLACRPVLACQRGSEPWVLLRVQQLGLPDITTEQLWAFVAPAEGVTKALLARTDDPATRQTGRILARADILVDELRAGSGVDTSDYLRSSLTSRLAALGEELRRAVARSSTKALAASPDEPLVESESLASIEAALSKVQMHALAHHRDEIRVERAIAGVRLTRWLATESSTIGGFTAAMRRYRDVNAWVDRAYSDAWRGVDEEPLSHGLRAVLEAVRLRRDNHDREFATSLALQTIGSSELPEDILLIEDLLADVVVPLAKEPRPVLLIVADGMSAAVATEIIDDVERRYDTWLECLPRGKARRGVAVSALPSLTKVSRCSLLSGMLATGQQDAERNGFASFMRAHGLTSALFHKLRLETSGAGFALSPEVGTAVDDIAGTGVVACVLNTIDDALDRSDPGIDWTTDAVSHLRPLLERARRAGRAVVLTSDHGHVIERREGRMLSVGAVSSNRSRPAEGGPEPELGEVRVTGTRVLMHNGDAVLAVDERLRYGPLKAGYHGGAAPAEVVVPLHILTPNEPPTGWALATPQQPLWWHSSVMADAVGRAETPPVPLHRFPKTERPTLFDDFDQPAAGDLAAQVLASETFAEQRKRAQRVTLSNQQIGSLIRHLVAAPGNRIDQATASIALDVPLVRLSGALPMAQRLLNVEQYPVLDRDADGVTVVLDLDLLKEQFGLSG
ncbi:BREX-2 system phosphatase PglZ [Mycobacterium intracellulare]|uniref:BREX-2 system phosphatase PglZ n=1 Tax=Mycobacterium intracellulare TaxID=1767 RepID=UPI001CD91B39|nr:BREX-2 system phosphatase PglZ [Mycobacterium intracellulare]MCA2249968.1 BREX-2 system phosphatase PglZ [Mycobacterium intracellulare]